MARVGGRTVPVQEIHYSVPYALVGEAVEIRATASVVEVLHKGMRVASHLRHYGPKGAATITDEHRPRAHREYGKWPPEERLAGLAPLLDRAQGLSFVDFGSAEGLVACEFLRRGASVHNLSNRRRTLAT